MALTQEQKDKLTSAGKKGLGILTGTGVAGMGAGLATSLVNRNKEGQGPQFSLQEAGDTRAKMLRTQLKDAQSPVDDTMVQQRAEQAYQAAQGPGKQANIEALRSGLAGGAGAKDMFEATTEKAMEEKAKATSEAYKQAGEDKLKQADTAYKNIADEEKRLYEQRQKLLWSKIPTMVGASGVAINKIAESGFLDDILGGIGGFFGGPGGAAAGKALGQGAADLITGREGGDPDVEAEALPSIDDEEAVETPLPPVNEAKKEAARERMEARQDARAEGVGEGGFELDNDELDLIDSSNEDEDETEQAEATEEATEGNTKSAKERARERRERLVRNRLAGIGEGGFELDNEDIEFDEEPPTNEAEIEQPETDDAAEKLQERKEAFVEQQQKKRAGGEGGFEQDSEDIEEWDQPDLVVEDEVEHSRTLADAANLPDLPMGSITDVEDFNEHASTILGSTNPGDVNAMYIAAGVRPPNNEAPSAESLAKAKAVAAQEGSDFGLFVKAIQEGLADDEEGDEEGDPVDRVRRKTAELKARLNP